MVCLMLTLPVSSQKLLNDTFNFQIPDREFLFGYELECLKIDNNAEILTSDFFKLNSKQILDFLQFVGNVGIDIFTNYHITAFWPHGGFYCVI